MNPKLTTMSCQKLRKYTLKNCDDDKALPVYMDRALAKPGTIYPAPQSIDD